MKWRGETLRSSADDILTGQNWEAYAFDKECQAVLCWPDDSIVRHNAAIIRRIEKDAEMELRAKYGTAHGW